MVAAEALGAAGGASLGVIPQTRTLTAFSVLRLLQLVPVLRPGLAQDLVVVTVPAL